MLCKSIFNEMFLREIYFSDQDNCFYFKRFKTTKLENLKDKIFLCLEEKVLGEDIRAIKVLLEDKIGWAIKTNFDFI